MEVTQYDRYARANFPRARTRARRYLQEKVDFAFEKMPLFFVTFLQKLGKKSQALVNLGKKFFVVFYGLDKPLRQKNFFLVCG